MTERNIPNPGNCKFCFWTESELRRRVIANGSIQFVHQCLNCGRSAGNPLPHSSIRRPQSLLGWDERIAVAYDERRSENQQTDREAWFAEHNEYLATPKWKEKRRLVIERCDGRCEGCRSAPVAHVHHLTYDHWKDELLFELVGLCEPCHHRAHKVVKFVGAGQ